MFITDSRNHVIRKAEKSGIISTIAGNNTYGYSGDGGPARSAQLKFPTSPMADKKGNLYFVDGDGHHVVRKIDRAGTISTVAGTGEFGYSGDGGPATEAKISNISDISIDPSGNLFIVDYHNGYLRKVDPVGIITTIAGNGQLGWSGDGGAATAASINPNGIAVDNKGNIYIAESGTARIRKIDAAGIITTIAGNGRHEYSGDGGPALAAEVGSPYDIEADEKGNIFFVDHDFHVVRKINANGIITTIAGNGAKGYSGDSGPPLSASLTHPVRLALDGEGSVYLTDVIHHTIRKISGCIETLPSSVAITASGTVFCQGEPVSFKATAANGGASPVYTWYLNNQPVEHKKSQFTTPDLQNGDEIYCQLQSSDRCTESSLSNRITVTVHHPPQVELGPDRTLSVGEQTTLAPSYSNDVTSVFWTPPTGLSQQDIPNPVAWPEKTTRYYLMVVSDKGCMATDSLLVVVHRPFHMPNAFSPNGDGKNDVFRIPTGSGLALKRFAIFSRWGEPVFVTTNIEEGWDERLKSKELPAGVYVYTIESDDVGPKKCIKGSMVLIR